MKVSATQKSSLDAICLPDAPYLADRLAAAKCAGVLSPQEYLEEKDYEGAQLCHKVGAMIVVVGTVCLDYRGIGYMSGATAVEKLGEVIGPEQASEFLGVDGKVYFHKLRLREYYGSAGMPAEPEQTPELTAGGLSKAANLDQVPTPLLHAAFTALEAKFTSGLTTADNSPDDMKRQGRAIFEALQKRIPHLRADSLLLRAEPPQPDRLDQAGEALNTAAPSTPPVEVQIVQKSAPAAADDANPDWMYVLSMVMQPNDGKDGAELAPDYDGEIYDRHLIRKIAYPYVQKYRGLGIMHDGQPLPDTEARVVQSYVVDDGAELKIGDRTYGPGTWFLGAEVKRDSDTGKAIEAGTLGAWSIDGLALKVPEKIEAAA